MPQIRRIKLHDEWVIWPESKPLDIVLQLKEDTREDIWQAGYQGDPIAEGGSIFDRTWWSDSNARYDIDDQRLVNLCLHRYIAFDTALKDKSANDPSAYIVVELLPDYRVVIRKVWQDRLLSADIPDMIAAVAAQWNRDEKLRAIVIEDKGSGTNAVQYLQMHSEPWLRKLIVAFMPIGSKEERARRITPFCKKKRVLLPLASEHADWLAMFTEQLYAFPGSKHDDMIDCLSMICDYLQNYLSDGLLRSGISLDDD